MSASQNKNNNDEMKFSQEIQEGLGPKAAKGLDNLMRLTKQFSTLGAKEIFGKMAKTVGLMKPSVKSQENPQSEEQSQNRRHL